MKLQNLILLIFGIYATKVATGGAQTAAQKFLAEILAVETAISPTPPPAA